MGVMGIKVLPPRGASGAEGAMYACYGFNGAAPPPGGERSGGGGERIFWLLTA